MYLAHQLCVDLGDTVDGARPLHAQIGCRVTGGRRAKRTNSAWHEHTQAVFGSYIEYVVNACRGRGGTLTSQDSEFC